METSLKWKRLAYLALIICLAFSFLAVEESAAAKVFKWRFQTHWPAASASYAPFKKFMEGEVRTLTDGRLFIEFIPQVLLSPQRIYSMPGQRIRSREVQGALTGSATCRSLLSQANARWDSGNCGRRSTSTSIWASRML